MPDTLTACVQALRNNDLAIFPTDTVFGLGASLSSPDAIRKLYALKDRPLSQPTAILISHYEQLAQITSYKLDEKQKEVLTNYWPGPLTVILPLEGKSPYQQGLDLVCGGHRKVGIRIPDHQATLRLIEDLGSPLVASSANIRGQAPPRSLEDIPGELKSKVKAILPGQTTHGQSSTIIDFTNQPWTYLRIGSITKQQIQKKTAL